MGVGEVALMFCQGRHSGPALVIFKSLQMSCKGH